MNLTQNPTQAELKQLLMKCDDKAGHHIIWVDHQGEVRISLILEGNTPANFARENAERIKFRLETFGIGNDYTGATAASDKEWVERLYKALNNLWADGYRGYCDGF